MGDPELPPRVSPLTLLFGFFNIDNIPKHWITGDIATTLLIQINNDIDMVHMNQRLARIVIDPNICFGKACIRGTRIWVSLILDFLASGMTNEDILAEYPQLENEDIQAALAYGAEMARDRYVEIPFIGTVGTAVSGNADENVHL
jgi:uncharacterized protein (DUF433 family)